MSQEQVSCPGWTTPDEALRRANQATNDILRTQWQQERLVVVQSPPGGGKTGLVERLAIQELILLRGRLFIATVTNAQAQDLARRLSARYARYPIHLFVQARLPLPQDLQTRENLHIARQGAELPEGPCIIIATAARWAWSDESAYERASCLVVDEAYQLAWYRFQPLRPLAERLVLVGDPGQIAPVVCSNVDRWRDDAAGPHVACPQALCAQGIPHRVIHLPVSRRLLPDTVALIQPAFYPTLPFIALSTSRQRKIVTAVAGRVHSPLDEAIDLVTQGASIVQLVVPASPEYGTQRDDRLAEIMVELVFRLFARRISIIDGTGVPEPLQPSMLGMACAHVAQISAITERLPYPDLLVETAERFQGLERSIMVVQHPLSGLQECDAFHVDRGRFCVLLSRHRLACFLVTRAGVEDMLLQQPPLGRRCLDIEEDQEYINWQAHIFLQQSLSCCTVRL